MPWSCGSYLWQTLSPWILLVWNKASCSPGWSTACYPGKTGFESLILPSMGAGIRDISLCLMSSLMKRKGDFKDFAQMTWEPVDAMAFSAYCSFLSLNSRAEQDTKQLRLSLRENRVVTFSRSEKRSIVLLVHILKIHTCCREILACASETLDSFFVMILSFFSKHLENTYQVWGIRENIRTGLDFV